MKKLGDIYSLELPDGQHICGRILNDAGIAIYKDFRKKKDYISKEDYLFTVSIFDDDLKNDGWNYVTNIPFSSEEDSWPPKRKVYDVISGGYSIYYKGEIYPSSEGECRGLETASVWHTNHIVDRVLGKRKI
jgi:hypothetical protein